MTQKKNDTRQKILQAASALARESGPGNISLDAVAARAGVSKGGLLYHFASKKILLEALVEDFLIGVESELDAAEDAGPNAMLDAYISLNMRERLCRDPAASGLLAALAKDPQLLAPVGRYERGFLDRIRANATDPELASIAFFALHGLRSLELLNCRVLDDEETARFITALRHRLGLDEDVNAS